VRIGGGGLGRGLSGGGEGGQGKNGYRKWDGTTHDNDLLKTFTAALYA
jgi:hypothetical protein